MMGFEDAAAREAIRGWIAQQHAEMERSSYYHLLGVGRDATEGQIRDAYYTLVARFHPDLYGEALDGDTRGKLVTLYSRLVEAYRCLADGPKRVRYDKQLAGGRLRFSLEEERGPRDPEAEIQNPNAKRFYRLGKAAVMAGDARSAVTNLKLALSVEPDSAVIKTELSRAESMLKGAG